MATACACFAVLSCTPIHRRVRIVPARFEGKVVVITGGATGMGLDSALRLSAEGAKIVVVGRRQAKLDEAAGKIKEAKSDAEVVTVAADVSTEAGNKAAVDAAMSNFGQLDGFFANAGMYTHVNFMEAEDSAVDQILSVNVKSVIFGIKYAMLAMKEKGIKGSILLNSSGMSQVAKKEHAGGGVYASTKSAVDMLARYAAIEGAEHGIRVNTINPGIVKTDIFGEGNVPSDSEYDVFASDKQLVGRAGVVSEISSFVAYLLSDEASFVTGSVHNADGGWTAC